MSGGPSRRANVCVLTPDGRGAVAVIRVWGQDALEVTDSVFRPRRRPGLAATPVGRLRLGRAGAGLGDEVVAVVSGTNPPEVEIQCHGGPAAIGLVIEALVDRGASRRPAEEWVRLGFHSTIEAQAAVDLTRAPTVRIAEILLDQADGALGREIRRAIEEGRNDPSRGMETIDALMARSDIGLRLLDGWRVVLAGRPNVGKSRLLNALAGYDRAIVDPRSGTTRDVVTIRTALDGWPVEIADTAGLRDSSDPIETAGVTLARQRQDQADLVLVVLDRSQGLTDDDRQILGRHPSAMIVANKCDLPRAWEAAAVGALEVSAERGDGLETLIAAIARRLAPDPPPENSGVPFRLEHVQTLERARRSLEIGEREAAIGALRQLEE